MKLVGITGTGSGKLGNSVFSVNAGQQIVRQYQPNVSNPSTLAQINQRAKMKLLAQIAAVVSSSIAIPKEGMVTPRNRFISLNFPFVTAENGYASMRLVSMQLTAGSIALPEVVVERVDDSAISAELAGSVEAAVSRVVYVAFRKGYDNTLTFHDSIVVEEAGANGTFPTSIAYSDEDVLVYAYGMIDANAMAAAKYSNYHVTSGEDIAYLIGHRTMSASDYLFTKTSGALLAREVSADFVSVVVDSVNIPRGGNTTIPYSQTVNITIQTIDAQGLYLRTLVEGYDPAYVLVDADTIQATYGFMVGGEVISFALGTYENEVFTPLRTYSGHAVVGAQNTQFTSVSVNGTAIAASGNTQVAQENAMNILVQATGDNTMKLQVSVNGTAQPLITKGESGYSTTLNGLQVSDVITFAIGLVKNGVFTPNAQYGGSAVVAVNPPSFTSLSVGGTAIASTGTTDVVAGSNLAVAVVANNAEGKYVGYKVGDNSYVSLGAISSGRLDATINVAIGDAIQFCIGTNAGGGTITPETVYGGTINGIDQPAEGLSGVSINGTPLTSNHQQEGDTRYNQTVVGTREGASLAQKAFAVVSGSSAPTLNSQISVANVGNFSGQETATITGVTLSANTKYWFVAGTYDGQNTTITVEAVYPYFWYEYMND